MFNLYRLIFVLGILSLLHAAYSAAQRKLKKINTHNKLYFLRFIINNILFYYRHLERTRT